jgi:hypothetical protein
MTKFEKVNIALQNAFDGDVKLVRNGIDFALRFKEDHPDSDTIDKAKGIVGEYYRNMVWEKGGYHTDEF